MQEPTKCVTESCGKPVITDDGVVDSPVTIVYFGDGGKVVPEEKGLAKKSTDAGSGLSRYWLKFATSGMDAGHLYNPQSPTFDAVSARRFERETGRPRYEFRPVKVEAFDLYIRFLETGNPINVRNAERFL